MIRRMAAAAGLLVVAAWLECVLARPRSRLHLVCLSTRGRVVFGNTLDWFVEYVFGIPATTAGVSSR